MIKGDWKFSPQITMLTPHVPLLWPLLLLSSGSLCSAVKKPNIVLILTDDQDKLSLSDRRFLPKINEHLVDHGVYYENFFTPVSICCPSRTSLFRTQLAHNHNVTFVVEPWGGWEVFNRYGYVGNTLPDWLQAAGYNTYYTGKLMNGHDEKNCESLPVSGFNSSDFLVDPYTYDYWNPGFSRDNGPVKVYKGQYSTDIITEKALDYLDEALLEDSPFFVGIAPIGPHSHVPSERKPGAPMMHIPASHPRHSLLFQTEQYPRDESWNPDQAMGVSWVKDLPKLNATVEAYLDEFYRGRLRSLQAIDELVEQVVAKLDQAGQLDNTYIVYTSDNGFALGTHRRQPGKTLGFESDIHVPLIVRGPSVPHGLKDDLSSYGIVDLSKTILHLAGAHVEGYEDDGQVIDFHDGKTLVREKSRVETARHSLSEYWVLGVEEGIYAGAYRPNNTYRTLRVHDVVNHQNVSYSYSVWCTGERELYDLEEDPHQVRNLLAPLNLQGPFAPFHSTSSLTGNSVLAPSTARLLDRLDALLLVLKTCRGDTCTNPYKELSTHNDFVQLSDLLQQRNVDSNVESWLRDLPKVEYSTCQLGYQSRNEWPQWKSEWAFGRDSTSRGALLLQV